MSYEQAMKHSKNHRKDRFYQQCSGYAGDGEPQYAPITEEQEERNSYSSMCKLLMSVTVFPLYIAQDKWGFWGVVPHNHIGGTLIESSQELIDFAREYAGVDLANAPWKEKSSF